MKKTKLLGILGISIMSLFLFSIMASATNKYIQGETIKPNLYFRELMLLNEQLVREKYDIRQNIDVSNSENYEIAQKIKLHKRLQPAVIKRITKKNFKDKIQISGTLQRINGFQRQKIYFEQTIDKNSVLKNLKNDDIILYQLIENKEPSERFKGKLYKAIIRI